MRTSKDCPAGIVTSSPEDGSAFGLGADGATAERGPPRKLEELRALAPLMEHTLRNRE